MTPEQLRRIQQHVAGKTIAALKLDDRTGTVILVLTDGRWYRFPKVLEEGRTTRFFRRPGGPPPWGGAPGSLGAAGRRMYG